MCFGVFQLTATEETVLTTSVGRSLATPLYSPCSGPTQGPRNALSEVDRPSPLRTTEVTGNAAALCPGWTLVLTSRGCCYATRPVPTCLALRVQVSSARKSINLFCMSCGNSAFECSVTCLKSVSVYPKLCLSVSSSQEMAFRSFYCRILQFLACSHRKY